MTYARTTSLVRRRHRDVRTYRVGGPGYRLQTVVRLRRKTFTTLAVLMEHRIGAARPSAAVAVGQRSQIWCPKEEPRRVGRLQVRVRRTRSQTRWYRGGE
jgi:hypothetical protein